MLKLALGSALLVTAVQAVAVSLGATQGSVIIGRPLDLLVQSNVTAAEAAAGLCLQAEVMYGDRRIPATAITAAIHQIGANGASAIRVRAAEPVNEPVVTLLLRLGCGVPFQRSYTLLADLEQLAPPILVYAGASVVAAPAAGTHVAADAASPVHGERAVTGLAPEQAAVVPEQTPISLAQPAPRPAAVTRMRSKARPLPVVSPGHEDDQAARQAAGLVTDPGPAPTPAPRLQLDPVDLAALGGLGAAAQTEPGTPVTLEQDAAAPAAEPAASLAQQQALEQELATMRSEQERMRLDLEAVNEQLRQAQSGTGQPLLVYGLSALSLLLLGALAYALRSRRRADAPLSEPKKLLWWESAPPASPAASAASMVKQASPVAASAAPAPAALSRTDAEAEPASAPAQDQPAWTEDQVPGLEVADVRESMFREVPVSPLELAQLQEVWQRVEFCVSIGQPGDAMDALKELLSAAPRCSEAPYLWWLHLAYEFGTVQDQAQASRFYESHFQRVPPSLTVIQSTSGLKDDVALLQAVAQDWPTAAARQRLLMALASQPGAAQSVLQVRTLASFDDLITLLGLLDALQPQAQGLAADTDTDTDTEAQATGEQAQFASWQSLGPEPQTPVSVLDFELLPQDAPPVQAPTQAPASPALKPLDVDFDLFEIQARDDTQRKEPEGNKERQGGAGEKS